MSMDSKRCEHESPIQPRKGVVNGWKRCKRMVKTDDVAALCWQHSTFVTRPR